MNNEPVAWYNADDSSLSFKNHGGGWQPLYTHPVKELIEEKGYEVIFDGEKYTSKLVEPTVKELTDKEIDFIFFDLPSGHNIQEFARAILRKAQEK